MRKFFDVMVFVILAVIFIGFLISLAWKQWKAATSCQTRINTTTRLAKGFIKNCIQKCWSKHDFGSDLNSDDCFIIDLLLTDTSLYAKDLENEYTKAYFERLDPGNNYKLKIRYNATAREINLLIMLI
jgi:hypothetical protein